MTCHVNLFAGHNPDPELTSFSCRITNGLRKLPEGERPNLIELLKEYGDLVSCVLLPLNVVHLQGIWSLNLMDDRQETVSWSVLATTSREGTRKQQEG